MEQTQKEILCCGRNKIIMKWKELVKVTITNYINVSVYDFNFKTNGAAEI